jgi:PmbA protein
MSAPAAHLDLARHAVELARAAGADQAEAYLESMRALSVRVSAGAVESVKHSTVRGLGLRVIVEQKVGFVSTTDLREETLAVLARRAVTLGRHSTADPANGLLAESPPVPDGAELATWDPDVADLPADRHIAMALELERVALGVDARIRRTDGCAVGSRHGDFVLVNTHGLERQARGTAMSAYVSPLAEDTGGKQRSGGYGMSKRRLAELAPPEAIAREAARRALAMVGARSVPAARVPVVLHPDVAAAWLSEIFDAFSGENVIKQSSWLTGKLGEPVASPLVTLVDDGLLPGGLGTEPCDDEGVPCRRNVLIERGVCRMFAYDLYHARRAGTRPTGNANRGYSSLPGIGYRNLFLEPGPHPPEEILESVERGFYMTDQGAFGYNEVTGDYSYQAGGFWIEGGEIAFPVDGVTVASNSLDMLRNVLMVGSDLGFEDAVASPTLKIAEMTLGGEGTA